MMRFAILLFVMFMLIHCANGSSDRDYYENRIRSERAELTREHNLIVEKANAKYFQIQPLNNNTPSVVKERLMEYLKYLINLSKIANLILPGFLTLDKAFIMTIIQFFQKRIFSDCVYAVENSYYNEKPMDSGCDYGVTNFIMLTINAILLAQQNIMIEENGEMFYDLHAQNLLPVKSLQKGLVIGIPFILEYPRFINPEFPNEYEADFSCSSILFAALTIVNDIIPAFTQQNFFIPLFIFSFFQHFDREGMWLIFCANITALCLFQNPIVDTSQVIITILFLIIKSVRTWGYKKKYFDIFSGLIINN